MKKYIVIVLSILIIVLAYDLISLYTGQYINLNFNRGETNYNVSTSSSEILLKKDGKFETFTIKGVELNSFYPGYEFSDYNIDKETYLKWIKEIDEMGANTIKVANRLDPDFYDALYEYNIDNEDPMYIFQCITLTDYDANNSESIYGFLNELVNECRIAVDVVHGNRYLVTSKVFARGLYSKDVSPWTLGYIISSIGKEETIAYTDNTDKRVSDVGYDGKYFYTKDGASETECIIALVMDEIVDYETSKYNEQRLVSLMVSMLQDTFEFKENVNVQMGKMCYINLNNIMQKDTFKAGQITSYNLEEHADDFLEILSDEEKEEYATILASTDRTTYYNGYVDFINKYYDNPVLIARYGHSTARIKDDEEEEVITEVQQGEKLVEEFKEFVNLECCGAIISSWQDNWSIESWNTAHNVDKENEIYWADNQSINQKYGLLAFMTADEKSICYTDGSTDDWNEKDCILDNGRYKLYAKYDYENVYIMVTGISENQDVYIPIDVTPKSGTTTYTDNTNLKFNREADFLIKIAGSEYGEILVQEYYDSTRAIYENRITGTLQYSTVPDKNSNKFVSMRAILQKGIDPKVDISEMTAEERKKYRMYNVYTTGRLVYGNSNPQSVEYNSLADYYLKDDILEIKIPWELLNFYAPNEMLIHDDYYENYGVEGIKVNEIYLGVGTSNEEINLEKLKLKPWNDDIEVVERLKKSYYIIKDYWNEE